MTFRSLARRRPSPALIVSFLALFVALGGASWAAFRLPVHSVGNAQLQNFSVGNAKLRPNSVGAGKIIAGAVGARQVNSSQVQLRVSGPCSFGAIQSISVSGDVTCTPVLPNEHGSTGTGVALVGASTQVVGETLSGSQAGSPYLVLGTVRVRATAATASAQVASVSVSCTLGAAGSSASAGTQADATLPLGDAYPSTGSATIPLVLPVTVQAPSQTLNIACSATPTPASSAPQVTATATINAIQTASNS
jgi:hypothetical protein